MRPWYVPASIGACVLMLLCYAVLGLVFVPLQEDGGWYSYPAYAEAVGRNAFSYQFSLAAARDLDGVAALFEFETTSFLRVLYTSWWFRLAGANGTALWMMSLLELGMLLVAVWLLYRSHLKERGTALIALALVAGDKTIAMSAATDFRPDIALAAAGVLLYVVLLRERQTWGTLLLACGIAGAASTIALTAPIALGIALAAGAVDALLSADGRRARRLAQVALVASVAAAAYLGREALFAELFATHPEIRNPTDPLARVLNTWSAGPWHIASVEAARWGGYFSGANALHGVILLLSLLGTVSATRHDRARLRPLLPALAGVGFAALLLATIDPHETPRHLIPVTPFLWLSLGALVEAPHSRIRPSLIGALTLGSAILGIALVGRIMVERTERGVANAWLSQQLAQHLPTEGRTLVVGPTELWPYAPAARNVLFDDRTRDPKRLLSLHPDLQHVDFVILNKDFDPERWLTVLRSVEGVTATLVVDRAPDLTIIALRRAARP